MEIYQFKNLLDQVKAINTRYKKINELTGENFNVFRILKLESSEVRMHSAFLAELLDPKGSHGQKDIFLKLFIKIFCFKENLIDSESCKVEIEKHTGFINDIGTEGGRIDIIITDKNNYQIIIENKIYASDQPHQLIRYYNYSNSADLIYLTLDGKVPHVDSIGELIIDTHFKCYSYKNDILEWLELCRKEVAIYPIIRESITQYINLIKYLTNQTLNHNMQEELSDLLKSNIDAAFAIVGNFDKALEKISIDFGDVLENECNKIDLNCSYGINFKHNYSGIWISKDEWTHVNIGFQFQSYNKKMIYGIVSRINADKTPIEIPIATENLLRNLPNNESKNNAWWRWLNEMEAPYNNWSTVEAWQAIINGDMKNCIMEKINILLKLTEGIEL